MWQDSANIVSFSAQSAKLNWRERKSQALYQAGLRFRLFLASLLIIFSLFSKTFHLDGASLVICFFYLVITFWTNSYFIFQYICFYISAFLLVGSVYFIESNHIWLVELRTWSSYEGSFPLLASYHMIFFLALEHYNNIFRRKERFVHPIVYKYNGRSITRAIVSSSMMLFFALIFISFLHVIKYPSFLINIDRFRYLDNYVVGSWRKLRDYLIYLFPISLVGYKCGYKKTGIFLMGFCALYLAWSGERMSKFLWLLYYATIVLVDRNSEKSSEYKRGRKVPFWLWLLLVFVVLLIAWVALRQYSGGSGKINAWQKVEMRFSMQGQLWWSVYRQFSGHTPHITELGDELQVFTAPNSLTPFYGIYKIMYLCAPRAIVTAKIAAGQAYTESTAASIFYYFGSAALFLWAFLFGLIFAWLLNWYKRCVLERRLVETLCVTMIAFSARFLWSMSAFSVITNKSFLFSVIMIILLRILRKPKTRAFNEIQ